MYKLVISDDEGKTIIVPLVRDLITVGRQDGNTIRLTERNVSRQHARFVRDEQGYRIEDLESFNGIKINGVRIDKTAELRDGDRVGVGDYVIALRMESAAGTTARAPAARPALPSGFGAPPPPRLVMISAPAPGAEFSITKPAVSIGRLEELDLCISHRSISREHARVARKGNSFEIEDLRSANGVRVNGRGVKRGSLRSGDVLELGQVRFRFIGPGENYAFDPTDEEELSLAAGRSRPTGKTLVALVGLCAVAGGMLAFWQDGSRQAGAAMRKEGFQVSNDQSASAIAGGEPADRLQRALEACRAALADERYAEALHAAEEGLMLPGSDDGLISCKRSANEGLRASAAYEQGTKALHENKLEDAYFLFAGIPDHHTFRSRSEVKSTIEQVAQQRLARAKKELPVAPAEAREVASSVLDMQDAPELLLEEAQRIVDATVTRGSSAIATTATTESGAGKPRARIAPTRPDDDDASKTARNCLARGDQRCVVRALEGRASNAQELALLIETYRALGETKKALRHMETFVARYATARQTPQYRLFIAKHEQ